jgi:hypothetical protein
MRCNWIAGTLTVVLSGVLAAPLSAQNRPRGLYAKVNIAAEISSHPDKTPAELETYLIGLYQQLLANVAIAGLTIQAHWDELNPRNPAEPGLTPAEVYNWSYLSDAFAQAATWNQDNPNARPKTIQLIISPGFQSPQWLLDELPSCDSLFESESFLPPADCGKVTFTGYNEQGDSTELPLPWNSVYKTAWYTFLVSLNNKFGSNPLLVSIPVSGPTAATEEMIMPNNGNTTNPQVFPGHPIVSLRGVTFSPPTSISPNAMWLELFQFHYNTGGVPEPAYQNSDQAFIEEWNNAINMYGSIFSGITLVATTGNGLPNFGPPTAPVPTAPIDFTNDCGGVPLTMDCVAETTILSYFVASSIGGPNAKAVQTSGVEASRADIADLGLPGVKVVSEETATFTSASNNPASQILGGAQFNQSVKGDPTKEGSSSKYEQALYNVLQSIFTDTQAGFEYCEPTNMPNAQPAPLNYVQIFSSDVVYAEENLTGSVDEGTCSNDGYGGTATLSAQDQLNQTDLNLLLISEPVMKLF